MSRFLDIINSIVVFQLFFFTLFLFIKGNNIPSTLFLKLHLIFQLIGFYNYLYFIHDISFLKPLVFLSVPCMFLWAPTFYFYVRSRLYNSFIPSWKLLIHGIPALIIMLIIILGILKSENFSEEIIGLKNISNRLVHFQLLSYYIYTLYILYKYKHQIKFLTSSNEKQKLNWLFTVTYGIASTSIIISILFFVHNTVAQGWFHNLQAWFVVYWIFLNIFFFKAIIHPDQFLGIDEKKLLPLKLDNTKCIEYFGRIEDIINTNQLYLDPELSLHNVAQAVRLSDRTVSQTIKQNTALNFTDYINIKRINYAKDMLRTTTKSEKNVLEILYDAGFNSKSVFNTQFKKHTGLSPTDFRNSNTANI